ITAGLGEAGLRVPFWGEGAGGGFCKPTQKLPAVCGLPGGLAKRPKPQGVEKAGSARGAQQGGARGRKKGGGAAGEKRQRAAADYIAKRLDALEEETERGWKGTFDENGFHFERTVRGVKEVAVIDQALLGSADARKLDEFAPSLQQIFPRPTPPAMLRRKDE